MKPAHSTDHTQLFRFYSHSERIVSFNVRVVMTERLSTLDCLFRKEVGVAPFQPTHIHNVEECITWPE